MVRNLYRAWVMPKHYQGLIQSVREKRSSSKEDVTNSSQPNICANVRGLDGRDGRDGSPGPRCQPGRDGRDGQAGQLGPRGEPGPAGGIQGPQGSSGNGKSSSLKKKY